MSVRPFPLAVIQRYITQDFEKACSIGAKELWGSLIRAARM